MSKIVKDGLIFGGTPKEIVTAWEPSVGQVEVQMPSLGSTDISNIGDGTLTGAISTLNNNINSLLQSPTLTQLTTTSAVRTGSIYMARWGHIVTVMLCAVGFTQTGTSQVIATGLPKILTQSHGVWQMHQDNGAGAHMGCLHINGTNLLCHVGNATITGYQAFTYITSED